MPKLYLEKLTEAKRATLKAKLEASWIHDKKDCWVLPKNNGYYSSFFGHRIHRLAYALLVQDFEATKFVCHKCDNPPCFNPDHLFIGDQKANMRDAKLKKRIISRSIYKGNTSDPSK
jgi:hypothetical protein